MRTAALAPLALAALAGCAEPAPRQPVVWWHASRGEAEWSRDRYECARDASMAAPPSQRITSTGGYMMGGFWIPPSVQSHDDSGDRRLQLTVMCLEARGWRRSAAAAVAAARR